MSQGNVRHGIPLVLEFRSENAVRVFLSWVATLSPSAKLWPAAVQPRRLEIALCDKLIVHWPSKTSTGTGMAWIRHSCHRVGPKVSGYRSIISISMPWFQTVTRINANSPCLSPQTQYLRKFCSQTLYFIWERYEKPKYNRVASHPSPLVHLYCLQSAKESWSMN